MPGPLRLVLLPFLAVLLAEAFGRAGRAPLAVVRRRDTGPLAAWGLAYLAGLLSFGTAMLGLALAGVLYPSTVLAVLGMLALAGPGRSFTPLRLAAAARELRAIPPAGRAFLGVCLLPLVLSLFIPDFNQDTWQYHLGMPWHFLRSHRALLSEVPLTFLTPLPFDLSHVTAILAGDDRLVQWTVFTCFAAVAAVFASFALARDRKWEAVAGLAGALAAGHLYRVASWSKNDMGAVACFASGFLLWRARERLPALFMFGLALAAKFTTGPAIAAFLLVCATGRALPARLVLPGTVLLLIPVLPWWTRSWLATGNPLFPFASQVIPTVNWDALNVKAFGDSVLDLAPADTLSPGLLPAAWFRHLCVDHPLVVLGLPAMLLISSWRREAAALVLGQFLTMATAHFPRYMLATGVALSFAMAMEAARLPGRLRRVALGALAAYGLAMAWARLGPLLPLLRLAPLTRAASEENAQPLYGGLFGRLERLKAQRVIVIGEFRSYRYPARIIWGGMGAETPVMWKLATQSRSADEMAKRVRQMGADRMVFNFITADWTAKPYRFYGWDDRALALYLDFCGRWMDLDDPAPECDHVSGGFHVYRFLRKPLGKAPPYLPFAPGTEGLYGPFMLRLQAGDPAGGRAETGAVLARMPRVLHALNQVGYAQFTASEWAAAMSSLRVSARSGVLDALNICEYGVAALNLGLLDEAEPALRASIPRYRSFRDNNLIALATALVMRSQAAINARKPGPAVGFLDEAESLVKRVSSNPANAKSRRMAVGLIHGMRGELDFQMKRYTEAAGQFTKALEEAPDHLMAPHWRSALEAMRYNP
jgi:tetratricopeptide (TPR) repeat protein